MELQDLQNTLRQGMRVKLIEHGEEISEGTITNLLPGELEFTDANPKSKGFKMEFGYKREWGGWKGLHKDPFTHGRCTSDFGPIYLFKPIEQSKAV